MSSELGDLYLESGIMSATEVAGFERRLWIADVKRRLGIRCIGDEPAAKVPDWPVIEEGATYTVVSDQAMASWDGVNFYVKPDGMTTAEFWAALAAGDRQ
jgi:hypothetical protein